MNNIHSSQVPSFRCLAPQFNLSQWPCITGSGRPPIAHIAPQSPTLGQIILGGLVLVGVGYVAYKIIVGPQERRLHCSECGRASHTARNCPFTGERRRFSSLAEDGLVRVLWRLVPSDATPSLRRPRRRFESNGDVPRVPCPLRSRRAYSVFCNQTSLLPGCRIASGDCLGRRRYTSDHEGLDQRGERLQTVPEVGEVL